MSFDRIGGIAGFCFAAGVLLQNGVLLQGAPLPSADLEVVQRFYVERAAPVSLAVGWVTLNVPLLLLFAHAVSRRMGRTEAAAPFGQVGAAGAVLLAGAFLCTTWLQAVLTSSAAGLADAGQLGLVWAMHSAAFGTSGVSLAVVLGAFSAGAWIEGTVPKWVAGLGFLGAASLVVSGFSAVATVAGGPGIFFQLGGFLTWVVWLLAGSIRLVRG
ncbi:MAG: hypothetical protein FJ102_04785 [Deltaproteobacteria bacterium]|nr:hypothetical protein [Deltaproteobacteria bacterium]